MTEAWTFIDGVKVSVPLNRCDAVKYGWHLGAEFKQWFPEWFPGTISEHQKAMDRDRLLTEWCRETFAQTRYKMFYDSVYFYHEEDAVLCQLRWS